MGTIQTMTKNIGWSDYEMVCGQARGRHLPDDGSFADALQPSTWSSLLVSSLSLNLNESATAACDP
jgi:hypothetical protein